MGTISEHSGAKTLTYPVTGAYTQAPAGTLAMYSGGTINVTWKVPTAVGMIKAGTYRLAATITADWQIGHGYVTSPNGAVVNVTLTHVFVPTT